MWVGFAYGAGAVIAYVQGIVLELFGIQLAVLLAAALGAFGARAFLPESAFWRALVTATAWTLAGGWLAELARWVLARYVEEVPPAAMPAIALVLACTGQRIAPIIWAKSGELLEAWFEKLRGRNG